MRDMLPNGTNRCQCAACKRYFGGVRAFEAHRVGPPEDRACMSQSRMAERGFRQDALGYWGMDYAG